MNRNLTLDLARSISMLYIIGFWHLFAYTNMVQRLPIGDYFKNATLGLFVFISAYLLSGRYVITSLKEFGNFIYRRFIRIIPLFAVALSSYLIVGFLSFKATLLALVGFSMFIEPQPPTLWFISMLIFFYYLLPLISGRTILFQIITTISIFILVFIWSNYHEGIDQRFFYYWPCFSLGIILSRYSLGEFINKWKTLVISGLLFSAISICHYSHLLPLPQIAFRLLISITGVCLLLSVAQIIPESKIVKRITEVISYLSMSAYLFHRQILDIVEKYIYWPEDGWVRVIYLSIFCLPVIFLLSYIIQKMYDFILAKFLIK